MSLFNDPSELSKSRRRHLVFAALLIAFGSAAYFQKLVMHPSDLLVGVHANGRNDLTTAFLRYRDESFVLTDRDGEFADWNPHIQMGVPIHGNAQSGLFYPPNWLVAVIGARQSLSWVMVAHMWWAGVGSFVLLRYLRLGLPACIFGGLMTVGTPYAVAQMAEGHYAQICVFAWLPWICWRFERFRESDGRQWKMLSVLVAVTFFAGHVQELYYLMLLLSGSVLCSSVACVRRGESKIAKSLILHWCVMAIVSGLLVAVDLIPIVLNNELTARSGKLPIEFCGDGLTLSHLQLLINPMSFGGPEKLDAPTGFYWTKLLYFGVINAALAMLAILTTKSSEQPARTRWFWFAVVIVLFSFGQHSPLFRAAYHGIPMIASFRVPARALFIGSLMISWLAALQINAFSRRDSDLTTSAGKSRAPIALAVALAGFATCELAWHADRVVATIPPNQLRTRSSVLELVSDKSFHRVMAAQSIIGDHEVIHSGAFRVRGYEPVLQSRYASIIDALHLNSGVDPDFAGFEEVALDRLNAKILDLIGVRYFVTSVRQKDVAGWKLLKHGTMQQPTTIRSRIRKPLGFGVYENEDPIPRAFVIGNVVRNQTPNELMRTIQKLESVDCRSTVLLNRDVLPEAGSRVKFKAAEIVEYKSNSVTIRADVEAAGYLVLTDMFHPGWTAYVDGEPTRIEPAYIAFRAVPLKTAGRHEIVFRYKTPGRNKGAVLSLAAVLVLIVVAVSQRRSNLRKIDPATEPPVPTAGS